jgi:hypothetical protein
VTAVHQPTVGGVTAPGRPAADNTLPPRTQCGHWLGTESRYCRATEGVRHYVGGRRCPQHTPAALAGRPEPQPGRGWPAHRHQATTETSQVTSWHDVTGALYVDLDGVRARYECLSCRATEGPVCGADKVAEFATGIRTDHRSRCAAPQESRS